MTDTTISTPTTNTRDRIITTEGLPVMLNVGEAAAITGSSERHIRHLLSTGGIRGTKLGTSWRIPRDSFLAQMGLA